MFEIFLYFHHKTLSPTLFLFLFFLFLLVCLLRIIWLFSFFYYCRCISTGEFSWICVWIKCFSPRVEVGFGLLYGTGKKIKLVCTHYRVLSLFYCFDIGIWTSHYGSVSLFWYWNLNMSFRFYSFLSDELCREEL